MLYYENLQLCLRLGLKLKKHMTYQSSISTMVKTIYWIQHSKKKIEAEKNGVKDEKAW